MKNILFTILLISSLISCKNVSTSEPHPAATETKQQTTPTPDPKAVHVKTLTEERTTLEEVVESYKGKVILVDYWASWCRPCRAVMPAGRELKKQYKDKGVEFVYVSIDTKPNAWEIGSIEEKLTNSPNNFLALNYPSAGVYQTYNLSSIPRYMLYNKKGQIAISNAARPGSSQLVDQIEKLLTE